MSVPWPPPSWWSNQESVMGRDAGISFSGIKCPGYACPCSACGRWRYEQMIARRKRHQVWLRKAEEKAAAAAIRRRGNIEATLLAGFATAGLIAWGFNWVELGFIDAWVIAVPFAAPLLFILAAYACSARRFERRWRARAHRRLLELRRKTLADAKKLLKDRQQP